jgi:hypothetical protein
LDEVLGFLQAERGHFANDLDDLDLLGARFLEDDVELGLLLDGGRSCSATRRRRSARRGHDGRDAKLRLEGLDKLRQLEDGHVADGVEQLFLVSHCRFFL